MTAVGTVQVSGHSSSTVTDSLADQAKRIEIAAGKPVPASPLLARLAAKLGVTVETLSAQIPSDTIRRTRYPVIERPQADGSVIYERPIV